MKRIHEYSKVIFIIFHALGLLLLFSIPFYVTTMPYSFGILLLFSIVFHKNLNLKFGTIIDKRLFPICLLFLLMMISFIYTENWLKGTKSFEVQLFLILFPTLFLLTNRLFFEKRYLYLITFVFSLTLSILISFLIFQNKGYASLTLEKMKIGRNLFDQLRYYRLNYFHHDTYYSYFLSVGIVFSITLLKRLHNKYMRFLLLLSIVLFTLFIFLLNSRAALLVLMLLFIYYSFKFIRKKNIYIKLITLGLILVSLFLGVKNTRLGDTLFEIVKNKEQLALEEERLVIWNNSLTLIKQKPIFGYGIGDAEFELRNQNLKSGFKDGIDYEFNAHNQFIDTTLQTGIIGLLVLISIIGIPLYISIKKNQELLVLFLIITIINFLFESMLQRLAGVVFFSFWYGFLYFAYYSSGKLKNKI